MLEPTAKNLNCTQNIWLISTQNVGFPVKEYLVTLKIRNTTWKRDFFIFTCFTQMLQHQPVAQSVFSRSFIHWVIQVTVALESTDSACFR